MCLAHSEKYVHYVVFLQLCNIIYFLGGIPLKLYAHYFSKVILRESNLFIIKTSTNSWALESIQSDTNTIMSSMREIHLLIITSCAAY